MKRVATILLLSLIGTLGFTGDMQLFNAGKKAFSVGLYKIAIENFQSFLEDSYNDPNSDDAIYLTAVSKFYLKDYNNSLSYLEGILEDYPSSPYTKNSYYWLGLNKFYLNDFKGSINDLHISMESSSYEEISVLYSSLAYTQLGERDKAKEILLKLTENRDAPQGYREEALYRQAILHLEDKNNNRAIISLNTLILDYPDSKYYLESLHLLGETYFLIGEWGSAKRSYLLLIEEEEDKGNIYKRLATISWELNEVTQSISWLTKYKEDYGFDHQVEYMLSDIYLKSSMYELAKRSLLELYNLGDRGIKRDEIAYKLGVIYYKDGNYKEAFKYFSSLNTLESNYYSAISGLESNNSIKKYIMSLNSNHRGDKLTLDANNRYINSLKSGNSREIEEALIYLTDIYPENISYSLTLGEYYLEKGLWDKSIRYLSKGYTRNSKYYSEISYKLGWIYYNKGEFDRAIAYFNKPVRRDKEYGKARYSKGIALYKLGKIDKGERTFKDLLENTREYNKEVSFYLGLIEKDRKNYSKAINYFNISVEAPELEVDSLSNIGWCYYLQRDFENAYTTYSRLSKLNSDPIYILNSGNSLYYLEKFEDSLSKYREVYPVKEYQESANYKIIEILFKLNRDKEAVDWALNSSVNSFNQLLSIGGDFLNIGEYQRAEAIFNSVAKESSGDFNIKARSSIGKLHFLRGEYQNGFDIFINLILSSEKESILEEFLSSVKTINDPILITELLEKVEATGKRKLFIPIYIEIFNNLAYRGNYLEIVEDLLGKVTDRRYFYNLSYIQAYYLYSSNRSSEAKPLLKAILESDSVGNDLKGDSILVLGDILDREGLKEDAASLYLNLYLNNPNSELVPEALYRAYLVLSTYDIDQARKVSSILKNEYSESIWKKKLNEN